MVRADGRRAALVTVCCVLLAGCGSSAPTAAPTPVTPPAEAPPVSLPAPPVIAITGRITDTVTGQSIGTFTQAVSTLPAAVTVSAPGYVRRETWVTTASPTVDLFPERGFDLPFYRELVRNAHEGTLQPLWVLPAAPAFYMEVEGRKGLSRQMATQLEAVARRLVPLLTGGRMQVTRWETGPDPRPRQQGWIMIERRDEPDACGRAYVGAPDGLIWLNGDSRLCDRLEAVFAHELGHAFGLWHTSRPGTMMYGATDWWRLSSADGPNDLERHHAALAYARRRGNTDVDVDPAGVASVADQLVVD